MLVKERRGENLSRGNDATFGGCVYLDVPKWVKLL
jgi:hypothetical protein